MPIEHVVSAIEERNTRLPSITTFRNYHRGIHQLRFATPDFRQKYEQTVLSLRENLCPAVVQAFTNKHIVTSWGDSKAVDEATEQGLNRMLSLINREVYVTGDAYALTWPGRDGTPRAIYHRADQGVPHVDELDPNQLDWWAKPWLDTGSRHGRINVYYPDRVERWITTAPFAKGDTNPQFNPDPSAWTPFDGDGDPDIIGHNFDGVPVCWWKRDPEDQFSHGNSILTDVVPLQDGLNKSVADLVIIGDSYAKPFWYLLNYVPPAGQQNPLVAAQQVIQAASEASMQARSKFDPTRQRIFTHDGPGPFGQLEPPDMTRVVAVNDAFAGKIARVAGVPNFYLSQTSGDVPSGESLRVLASRLSSAVREFNQISTPVWRGQGQLLGVELDPQWADPMPLSEAELLEQALLMDELGVPMDEILRRIGWQNADEIAARILEARGATAAEAGRALRDGQISYTE